MPRPPKAKTPVEHSTTNLGFEAISLIGGVPPLSEMFLQILCLAEGNDRVGDKESRSKDILGRVYEPSEARQTARSAARRVSTANQYFLTQFASAEGKNGGQSSGARKTATVSPQGERGGVHQFYTPSCDVRLLVEMLAPYKGRIYDPACGSGGSLPAFRRLRRMRFAVQGHAIAHGSVQSEGQDKWARRQRQQPKQSNATTRRLAIMNLAIRGIEADFGPEHADTFRRDLHPDLRADYVLANPPFNNSDTALRDSAFLQSGAKMQVVSEAKDNFRKDDDVRWQPSGARSTAKGSPQGERGGVYQFGRRLATWQPISKSEME